MFGWSLYFLLQTLFGSHRSFIQLLFLVITGAMSCQAGASAGQVWAGLARVGCLERQEGWAGRTQASFKKQVRPMGPDRPEVGLGESQGKA